MKEKKGIIMISILCIVLIGTLLIRGKKYMDQKALERDYQQGIELIQTRVTEYLVENYAGIEKVEWQGIGIEWRKFSMLGNYVKSDAKIFVSKSNYFEMHFVLSEETTYDYDLKKYILYEYDGIPVLRPSNIDIVIEAEIDNAIYSKNFESDKYEVKVTAKEKTELEKVKKSSRGSSEAEFRYNLDIYKLEY